MKNKVLKAVSYILVAVGIVASGAASVGCGFFFLDEPEMPQDLLE